MANINIDRTKTISVAIFVCDIVIVNLVLFALIGLVGDHEPSYFHDNTRTVIVVANLSVVIAEAFFRSIVHLRLLHLGDVAQNVLRLTATSSAIIFLLQKFIFGDGAFIFMAIFFAVTYVCILLSRMCERAIINHLRRNGHNLKRVLFVGDDPAMAELYKEMVDTPEWGYRPLGYYSNTVLDNPKTLKYLGTIAQLNQLMVVNDRDPLRTPGIDLLFCSLPHEEGAEVQSIMRSCDKNVIRFYYVPRTFTDDRVRLSPVRMGDYVFFTSHSTPLQELHNRVIKRAFDIMVSLAACIFVVPVTLVVGLIIKIQSPGPIFFKQQRTGLNGQTFWCYKFRSMHVNKNADTQQATENDPRKFPFGDFMRKFNIDELPQFFNVLIGNMSIVGPRPHMLIHTEIYGKLIDKYMVRHFCKPGITGWAQVTGCRGETKEQWQMEERIKRDIWYVEHWSFWLDLRIMFMTARSCFVHDEHAY